MRLFVFVLMAFCLVSCATSRPAEAAEEAVVQDTAELTGSVVVFGNEPFTYAGIVASDGTQYAIYPQEKEKELIAHQSRQIRFTVVFLDEPSGTYGSLYLKGGTVQVIEWEFIK
jgi:hypothetical protein